MKIRTLEIDGFGVWDGLHLEGFSPGLTVVYGPNEAGKSTLLEFLRGMLYGFDAPRSRRYLSAVTNGNVGGALEMTVLDRHCRLTRSARASGSDRWDESVRITLDKSRELGANDLPKLLDEIDEPVFNNVFAVGLNEIQELGTLTDTDAARLLYDLTAGLDRVSLGEVSRELHAQRRRLVGPEHQPGEIDRLIAERDRLQAEIDEDGHRLTDYSQFSRGREQIEAEIAALEAEKKELEQRIARLELAGTLRDRWNERNSLDEQLTRLGKVRPVPEKAVGLLEKIDKRLQLWNGRRNEVRQRYKKLLEELRGLRLHEGLRLHAGRVQPLAEQFLASQQQHARLRDHDQEIAKLEAQVVEERSRPAPEETIVETQRLTSALPQLDPTSLGRLTALAHEFREADQEAETIKIELARLEQELADEEETHAREQDRIEAAEEAHETAVLTEGDYATNLESAGNLVTLLRRRLQLEQRLEALRRQEQELDDRSTELVEQQLLPGGVLAGLGALFILGVMLVLGGLFLPKTVVGANGWALALLGMGGMAAAAIAKHRLEMAAEQQLATCERQSSTVRMQVKQVRNERDALDAQLPSGGGPITVRLEAAERRLREFEAAAARPRTVQRTVVRESRLDRRNLARLTTERDSARNRAKESQRRLTDLRRDWTAILAAVGWPATMSGDVFLKTVQEQTTHAVRRTRTSETWTIERDRRLRDLERLLEQRRRERDELDRSHRLILEQVRLLVSDVALPLGVTAPGDQLAKLKKELRDQEERAVRRRNLQQEERKLKRRDGKTRAALKTWTLRRRKLLQRAGAKDEDGLRRAVARFSERARLHARRVAVHNELTTSRGNHFTEEELRPLFADSARLLNGRWEDATNRLHAVETELRELFARRGEVTQTYTTLAADRRMAARQMELAAVEERLRLACEKWQVLALTQQTLHSVRQEYERDHQPETLCEATSYFQRLTGGRYRRIWTPVDADMLFTEDSDGHDMSVDALSRGTREQLFLSLRLALVSMFSRRGADLPVILDDVFVNFDDQRAELAADLLVDYVEQGRQVVVFTCHEHIMRLFKARRVPIIRLPSRAAGERHAKAEVEAKESRKRVRKDPPAVPTPEPTVIEAPQLEPLAVIEPVIAAPVPVAPVIVDPLPVIALPPEPPKAPQPIVINAPQPVVVPVIEPVVRALPEPVVPKPHFKVKPLEPAPRDVHEAPIDPDSLLLIDDAYVRPAPAAPPVVEPTWQRDQREAPLDPDAEVVIDDAFVRPLPPRPRPEPVRWLRDDREAPEDPDANLWIDADYWKFEEPLPPAPPVVEAAPVVRYMVPEPKPRTITRRWWRPFTGEGAEEFAGEFAERGPGVPTDWDDDEFAFGWPTVMGTAHGTAYSTKHLVPHQPVEGSSVDGISVDGGIQHLGANGRETPRHTGRPLPHNFDRDESEASWLSGPASRWDRA